MRYLQRPQRATVLPAARAPMPTGWRPSATTTSAIASRWTPTPPTGGRWRATTWPRRRATPTRDTPQPHRVTLAPHTADGVKVAREHLAQRARERPAQDPPAAPMIVLETALPI